MNEDLEMYCRFSSKNGRGSEGNIQSRQQEQDKEYVNTGKTLLSLLSTACSMWSGKKLNFV